MDSDRREASYDAGLDQQFFVATKIFTRWIDFAWKGEMNKRLTKIDLHLEREEVEHKSIDSRENCDVVCLSE